MLHSLKVYTIVLKWQSILISLIWWGIAWWLMNLKAHMKIRHSKKFFNVHVKKIKIEIHPKMIMIWTYENMTHFRPVKSP
jgi:hypothetical protein